LEKVWGVGVLKITYPVMDSIIYGAPHREPPKKTNKKKIAKHVLLGEAYKPLWAINPQFKAVAEIFLAE